uniref:Uncharacterized protein n=1 Tax=Rhizophora mucronata TaxID=61149 RepID=A0A2P2QTW7_RHIMU
MQVFKWDVRRQAKGREGRTQANGQMKKKGL